MSLISDALAASPALPGEPSQLAGLMPIILIAVVFYFLIIRPQQKKYKAHVAMVSAIAKGDRIVTSGGMIGTVTKVEAENDTLQVEIAEGVKVKIIRSTVASVLGEPKAEKANDNVKKDAKAA
jgi:preprotein translocase subunit YajC